MQHIAKGWGKAGISGLLDGQMDLPPEDLFTDIELTLEIDKVQEIYASGTHSSNLIHGYSVNMYYTTAKNVKHKDNVFDYGYGTRCHFYNLVLL